METIGSRIKSLRESKGLSQGQLGKLTGLNPKYIGAFEQGRRTPGPKAISALCGFLMVDEKTLRYGSGEVEQPHPRPTRRHPEERRSDPALRLAFSEVEGRIKDKPLSDVYAIIGRMLRVIDDYDKAA